MSDDVRGVALKAALENAIKHKGRSSQGAVIGSVVQALPAAKEDMKSTAKLVGEVIGAVNALTLEEQEEKLLALDPEYHAREAEKRAARKEERQELPELEGAEQGKVRTRMCPEPSKYNHAGHALNFLINYLYAKKYDGSCLLRFEDTNPERESQEYVDAMIHDVLEYLGIEPDAQLFVSDHVPRYYEACDDLIKRGLAYTCSCEQEEVSRKRRECEECACRDKDVKTVDDEWARMRGGSQEHVLRLKIDMSHKNAVMRDPIIMRVVDKPHFRHGDIYKAWPMYDFENALEDSWNEVTHVLRSNEFETRIELHNHIKDLFKLPRQYVRQYGRFNIVGATTKGREIRAMIESGEAIGWDDPKLVTLRALKRRGIVKETFYELAKQSGLSKTPTNIGYEQLAAINRRILDEEANRYFFVEDPVAIEVEDWPSDLGSVELKLHPHKKRGGRELTLDGSFYLSKKDYDKVVDGRPFRLIDTINLHYKDGSFRVHSRTIDEFKRLDEKHGLVHFLPKNEGLHEARIFMPDHTYREGLCEPLVSQLRAGAHVQLERVCFARLDSREDGVYTFWYSHE